MAITQSLAWWCFARGDMTPEHLVRVAADIGYDAIELADPQYWPLIRDHGLAISCHGGHLSIADGLNRRENHDRIKRDIESWLEQAVKWHIPNLICFSGNRVGLDDERGSDATVE